MHRAALAVLAVAVLAVAVLAACGSEPTSRCIEVCDREARCIDELNERAARGAEPGAPAPKLDSGECATACKALERDEPEGKQLVHKHVECVRLAATCDAVIACD
jgi:hypothetical protein